MEIATRPAPIFVARHIELQNAGRKLRRVSADCAEPTQRSPVEHDSSRLVKGHHGHPPTRRHYDFRRLGVIREVCFANRCHIARAFDCAPHEHDVPDPFS